MILKYLSLFLIAAASVLLAGCRKKSVDRVWWEAEQERIELAQRLALKEFRLIQQDDGRTEELDGLERRNQDAYVELESLSARRDDLREEIDSMELGMVAMRQHFLRNRMEAANGKTFDTFTAHNGRTYHEVSISSVDDAGVTIRHADGLARLRYGDLNDDQREMFGLDAGRALAALTKERADAAEYERWIEHQLVGMGEKGRLVAAADQVSRTRTTASGERSVVATNVSPLARPATEFSSRESGYSRRYYRYRPRYRYYYYPVPVYRNACVPDISYLNRLPKDGKPNPYKVTRTPTTR